MARTATSIPSRYVASSTGRSTPPACSPSVATTSRTMGAGPAGLGTGDPVGDGDDDGAGDGEDPVHAGAMTQKASTRTSRDHMRHPRLPEGPAEGFLPENRFSGRRRGAGAERQ